MEPATGEPGEQAEAQAAAALVGSLASSAVVEVVVEAAGSNGSSAVLKFVVERISADEGAGGSIGLAAVSAVSSGPPLPAAGAGPLDRSAPLSACGAVRFFSPKEILNMLGFPAGFSLPPDMELRHCYKVVGNSIAVTVVADLLRALNHYDPHQAVRLFEQQDPNAALGNRDAVLKEGKRAVAATHELMDGIWNQIPQSRRNLLAMMGVMLPTLPSTTCRPYSTAMLR